MTDTRLVRCSAVSRVFAMGATTLAAVRGASCVVDPGDRVAILGRSGSGKSTLLHLIAGLEAPDSGAITWPSLGRRETLRPLGIGVVFQEPALIASLSVLDNVALPLLLARRDPAGARLRAREVLASVGIAGLADRLPEELSGGQAERVAIARGLAPSPRLLLADEPTGQLDQVTGDAVLGVLDAACEQLGAALVVTTHDDAIALRFRTRWRMTDGLLSTAPAR